jgi:adenosylhomocysteinase
MKISLNGSDKKNCLIDGDYWIADPKLAEDGFHRLELARLDMPGLVEIVTRYKDMQPLKGTRIAISVIPTDPTGNLVWALKELGANVRLCSDNRVSTRDDIAAALVAMDIPVFARRNQSKEEFTQCFREVVKFRDERGKIVHPHQIIDDGFDLTLIMHEEQPGLVESLRGVTEQTTCGVNFAHRLMMTEKLRCPIIDINSGVKADFDNRFGTRESFLHSYFECINIELGGKVAVLVGYGPVGKGCVDQLRTVGSRVVVVEADPIRAAEALMVGLQVDSLEAAATYGDLFVVSTGSSCTITEEHLLKMKNGAILCNMGENYLEYDTIYLHSEAVKTVAINENIIMHILPNERKLYSLVDGGLMNMRGGGHPPRLLSITFCLHILMQIELSRNEHCFQRGRIYKTPRRLQEEVMLMNFPELQGKMSQLTEEQLEYMGRDCNAPFAYGDDELIFEWSPVKAVA